MPMDPIVAKVVAQALGDVYRVGAKTLIRAASLAKHAGGEQAYLASVGQRYTTTIERRHNSVRIMGMERPIPLRQLYVRVCMLDRVTANHRARPEELERTFKSEDRSFAYGAESWDGSEIVSLESYEVTDEVIEAVSSLCASESRSSRAHVDVKRLATRTYRGADPLLRELATVARSDVVRQHAEGLKKLARRPPVNYVILGKPGAGKSTFLKHLALLLVDGSSEGKRIPFFVGLKDYADSASFGDLQQYIASDLASSGLEDAKDWIRALLEQGRCVLLLDGLDEVPAALESRLISEVERISERYHGSQIVVSCRVAAYGHYLSRFVDLELADFDSRQVTAFVRNWFSSEPKTATACISKISERSQTLELARTPLLLTLLCLAFDQTLGFPTNRAELYREGVEALLKKWDASRRISRDTIYKGLSLRRRENLLSAVAARTFEAGEYLLPRATLLKYIRDFVENLPDAGETNSHKSAEEILKAIEAQHGFFVERARDVYSFSHLTFQEYFAAVYLVDHGFPAHKLIARFDRDKRWREVILLTTGLLPNADEFFRAATVHLSALAARSGIDAPLSAISELVETNRPQQHDKAEVRLTIFAHWVQHVGASPQSTLHACLESLYAVMRLFNQKLSRLGSDQLRQHAGEVARSAGFAEALLRDRRLELRPSHRGDSREGLNEERLYPERSMQRYCDMNSLVFEALFADCYLSKTLREQIRREAFSPDVALN